MLTHRAQRSRAVLGLGCLSPVSEQFTDQIRSCAFVTNPGEQLLACQQQEPIWRLQQHKGSPLGEARPLTYICRNDESAAISHHNCMCPTHSTNVPLYFHLPTPRCRRLVSSRDTRASFKMVDLRPGSASAELVGRGSLKQ